MDSYYTIILFYLVMMISAAPLAYRSQRDSRWAKKELKKLRKK